MHTFCASRDGSRNSISIGWCYKFKGTFAVLRGLAPVTENWVQLRIFSVINNELQFGKKMPHTVLYLKLGRNIFGRLFLKKSVVAQISFLYPNSPLLETCFCQGHKLRKDKPLY